MPLDVVFLGERGVCAAKIGGNRLVGRESVEFAKLRLPLPSRLLGAFVRLLLRGPIQFAREDDRLRCAGHLQHVVHKLVARAQHARVSRVKPRDVEIPLAQPRNAHCRFM